MSDDNKKIICLAGMGRSGTSLMASYLQHCGIPMGDKMLAAGKWNRKGFYEDIEFLEFHKNLLKINKSNLYLPRKSRTVPEPERQTAIQILERRSESHSIWGWKDPRTSLFMDLWLDLDKDIKFIFMYRSPYEVIESIFRIMKGYNLYLRPWIAVKGWIYYNRELLKLQKQYPERCAFVSIHGFDSKPEQASASLAAWLDYDLSKPYSDVYEPTERRAGSKPFPINLWMPLAKKFYGDELSHLYKAVDEVAIVKSNHEI